MTLQDDMRAHTREQLLCLTSTPSPRAGLEVGVGERPRGGANVRCCAQSLRQLLDEGSLLAGLFTSPMVEVQHVHVESPLFLKIRDEM